MITKLPMNGFGFCCMFTSLHSSLVQHSRSSSPRARTIFYFTSGWDNANSNFIRNQQVVTNDVSDTCEKIFHFNGTFLSVAFTPKHLPLSSNLNARDDKKLFLLLATGFLLNLSSFCCVREPTNKQHKKNYSRLCQFPFYSLSSLSDQPELPGSRYKLLWFYWNFSRFKKPQNQNFHFFFVFVGYGARLVQVRQSTKRINNLHKLLSAISHMKWFNLRFVDIFISHSRSFHRRARN